MRVCLLRLCKRRRCSACSDCAHICRKGCQMGLAIPVTVFGSTLTLLDSFAKLAAPRLAIASETSRETLEPMMDMLLARGRWHNTSPSLRILLLHFLSRVCNCEQRHSGFSGNIGRNEWCRASFISQRTGRSSSAHAPRCRPARRGVVGALIPPHRTPGLAERLHG